ncbi:MAG TPA: metal-dependent hydrolase [Streptosporangiaceae bacterium]|nr:metal-dependent hydrolase [Streptosporangiaceae bacterium]
MCLGHTHALSGIVSGLAVGLYATHLPAPALALFTGLTAGAAVLPDIDHPNSSLAHCFGFLTKACAWLIGTLSGGHRHLTHAILGVGGFAGLAWLAVKFRPDIAGKAGLVVFLSLLIASGLYALGVHGHLADAFAVAGAIALTLSGIGLSHLALAVLIGCATHVAGDMLTDEGCPLLFPFSGHHFRLLPKPIAFTTGTKPELWVLDPALFGGLGLLLYRAFSQGVITLIRH